MTIVSTKEFVTNENKYFDMAMSEEIFVKRDNMMFIVARVNENRKKKRFIPDNNLHKAITFDELLERSYEDIHQLFANK